MMFRSKISTLITVLVVTIVAIGITAATAQISFGKKTNPYAICLIETCSSTDRAGVPFKATEFTQTIGFACIDEVMRSHPEQKECLKRELLMPQLLANFAFYEIIILAVAFAGAKLFKK